MEASVRIWLTKRGTVGEVAYRINAYMLEDLATPPIPSVYNYTTLRSTRHPGVAIHYTGA